MKKAKKHFRFSSMWLCVDGKKILGIGESPKDAHTDSMRREKLNQATILKQKNEIELLKHQVGELDRQRRIEKDGRDQALDTALREAKVANDSWSALHKEHMRLKDKSDEIVAKINSGYYAYKGTKNMLDKISG